LADSLLVWRDFCRELAPRMSVLALLFLIAIPVLAQESQWIRPQKPGDPLLWGRRDGIIFGLPSEGGLKGPRGLIRIGLFTPGSTAPQLLNYIAVEPVTQGMGNRYDRMAFSELEMSELDPGQQGKRMWVHAAEETGTLQTVHAGDETLQRLSVRIDVERFSANGAHVYLIASVDSDQPNELRLSAFADPDSPPLDELTVTATMGNYERLRLLWLKNRVESSHSLFADYKGEDFAEHESYPLSDMLRSNDGDAIVYCTSDEASPRETAGNSTAHWPYQLPKITQYWRVPGHDVQPDLRVRVNARRVYWASTSPVLGGVAFENFEVRQRYLSGQTFIYGISPQEPWLLYEGTSRLEDPSAPKRPATAPR
jgi:hypothetical protein